MSTAVCTDASALVPATVAERLRVDVVPIAVTVDGEPFDERTQPIDAFYAQLERGAVSTTSQPSPADFAVVYARAASRGAETVLSIHLDARISGTISCAELAASEAPLPVEVIDSTSVSFGVGVCVRAAAEALETGASAAEAARHAADVGAKVQNAFVARGGPDGRVPGRTGWAVLTFANGVATPVADCRSADAAIDAMAALVHYEDGAVKAAVGHAGAVVADLADLLADMVGRSLHVAGVERYRVGPAVGAHTGPVSFGLFWWPAVS